MFIVRTDSECKQFSSYVDAYEYALNYHGDDAISIYDEYEEELAHFD